MARLNVAIARAASGDDFIMWHMLVGFSWLPVMVLVMVLVMVMLLLKLAV